MTCARRYAGCPGSGFSDLGQHALPNFQLELPVLANQLEVRAVAGNQLSAVGPDGESDQHVEVQIAQFPGLISFVCVNLR